jgi:glycosyltransferase involved in cell wall biosynthesis
VTEARSMPNVRRATDARAREEVFGDRSELQEIVVCSLKAWDQVWNRNNFLVDALLRRNSSLRILFVEPPADPIFDLSQRRRPVAPRWRALSPDGRLRALRPLKVLPRRVGPSADQLLRFQVRVAVRRFGFKEPLLWVNDVTYAPLMKQPGWPSLYDVSDDWLLAPFTLREIERLRGLDRIALEDADEVVVCSNALARSRGDFRSVRLVPNAVDVEHFRRPRPRPADLPLGRIALYAGTAHDARIDVALVTDLANALPDARVVFVGPNALSQSSRLLLEQTTNVVFLGPRPYQDLPGYLQHADVVIIPHRVSPFMESLDPIKAYECMAISTPTVATPLPGFREHSDVLNVVARDDFPACVARVMEGDSRARARAQHDPPSWDDRADVFETALRAAVAASPNGEMRRRVTP